MIESLAFRTAEISCLPRVINKGVLNSLNKLQTLCNQLDI